MRNRHRILLALLGLGVPAAAGAQTDRLGQAGLTFLDVPVGARTIVLGGMHASPGDALGSAFTNPSALGLATAGIWMNQQEWIADIVHQAGIAALRLRRAGTFAIAFQRVDYGTLHATHRADNDAGFEEAGTFEPVASTIGIAWGRELTDRLHIGAHVRRVAADFGTTTVGLDPTDASLGFTAQENDFSAVAFDIGASYESGYRGLALALSVRNFAREARVQDKYFPLPLVFDVNTSIDAAELLGRTWGDHQLRVNGNVLVPRDAGVRTVYGAEYGFRGLFFGRLGYADGFDERGISAGFGVRPSFGRFRPRLDYAWTDRGIFGGLNTFSFGIDL